MLGIDPTIICHRLAINPVVKPVKQKPRKMNEERIQALSDKVDQLPRADFIPETFYSAWLANSVIVKKKNDK